MKKIYLLLLLCAVITAGCSVDNLDSENFETADAKAKKMEASVLVYEGPGNGSYVQNSGKTRGHIYVSNDCNYLYVEIIPTEGDPDDPKIGLFQGEENFPPTNGTDGGIPDNSTYLENLTWTFPLELFDTTQPLSIFSKAWGSWAGTNSWGNQASYLNYTFIALDCEQVCTYGKGHWRNHSNDNPGNQENIWPVDKLTLGTTEYSQDELNNILDAPNNEGNNLVIFSQHLIAAKLNVANGAGNSDITATIAEADEKISTRRILEDSFPPEWKKEVNGIKDTLEAFNGSNPCGDNDQD